MIRRADVHLVPSRRRPEQMPALVEDGCDEREIAQMRIPVRGAVNGNQIAVVEFLGAEEFALSPIATGCALT